MEHPGLRGLSILVVKNELLIAVDIVKALEGAGTNATMTTTARHALSIPYISYTGYVAVAGADPDAPHISKPVSMNVLMSALEDLLAGRPVRVS